MAVQSLTYIELAEVWDISKEAARKKVEGLHLPRKLGNDGRTRVQIDLAEVMHAPKPVRPETSRPPPGLRADFPPGDRVESNRIPAPEILLLQDHVSDLRADLERERSERVQERDRADRLAAELADATRRFTALVGEVSDLATLRERLAGADRQRADAEVRHAAELRALGERAAAEGSIARAELAAWRSRPWWKRLAG